MYNDDLLKGFNNLKDKVKYMEIMEIKDRFNVGLYYKRKDWLPWAISCKILIENVFGKYSPFYIYFDEEMSNCDGSKRSVELLQNILINASEAFEGGYAFNSEISISGEVLGDFIALAKEAFASGHEVVAAVLASAALEDGLKRYAKLNGLEVESAPMREVLNALKSKELLSGTSKKLLEAMPSIRNDALHARWEKIDKLNASGIINAAEQFLLAKFSS